jgi:hypothetical protein
MTFWYGSGSSDPYLCTVLAPAPDPVLFVSGLQDANKKLIFAYYFFKVHLHHSSR